MLSLRENTYLDPGYKVQVSGGHRASESVQLLKEFYNGENPYAPNPKVYLNMYAGNKKYEFNS